MESNITTQAFVAVSGKPATDRKLAVVHGASAVALAMLAAKGGKVGKAAGGILARGALVDMVAHCASSNYRPLAEYLAGITGEAQVISRHSFHALPDVWMGKLETLRATGAAVNSKGETSARAQLCMDVISYTRELIRASEELREKREAERQQHEPAEKSPDALTLQIAAELDRIDAETAAADETESTPL